MIYQVNRLRPLSGNDMLNDDLFWMQKAIDLAKQAARTGEVPVGAVLVLNDEIIGQGFNLSISHSDPTAHAEIIALRTGAEKIGNYRLLNSTLYVTLEPCVMCAGAMVHARVKKLIYGAYDFKSGAVSSQSQVLDQTFLNHKVQHTGGFFKDECGALLSEFFSEKRSQ